MDGGKLCLGIFFIESLHTEEGKKSREEFASSSAKGKRSLRSKCVRRIALTIVPKKCTKMDVDFAKDREITTG
jgi:hypothetical protein